MNHDNEKELFKRAYLNLRTADSIPFPDAVFDEYVRLRDSEGYKLVPLEPTDIEIESIKEKHWGMRGCQLCKSDYIDLYKAMIGACND